MLLIFDNYIFARTRNFTFRIYQILVLYAVLHGVTSDSHGDDDHGGACYKKLPSQLELVRLDNNITGRLVFPEPGEDYAKYNFMWNLRFKTYVFYAAFTLRQTIGR